MSLLIGCKQELNDVLIVRMESSEDSLSLPLRTRPEYVMFGTYRAKPSFVRIEEDAIIIGNVSVNAENNNDKFNVSLPPAEVRQTLVCADQRCPLLLLSPIGQSCAKIQECLYLGDNSPNGLKLDTSSPNPREHYIVIVYKEKTNEKFAEALMLSDMSDSNFKQIDSQMAKQFVNNFLTGGKRVVEVMSKAFDNPEDSDLKFKLCARGRKRKASEEFETIHVHKWFVRQSSEYFGRMLANDWKENRSNEIEIKDFSYEAFYEFLRYLYTDCIATEDIDVLLEMWSISDRYVANDFKSKCNDAIKLLVDIDNVCTVYAFALRFGAKHLEEFCFKTIVGKNKEIVSTKAFESMESNVAKELLKKVLISYK